MSREPLLSQTARSLLDSANSARARASSDAVDAIVEKHFTSTMPKSHSDFMGVEHFASIGVDLGFRLQGASRTYGAILRGEECPDPSDKVWNRHKIDLSSIGLVVCERVEHSFPACPPEYLKPTPKKDRIVQVGSLIVATPELLRRNFYDLSDTGREILAGVVGELVVLPETAPEPTI